MKLKELQGALQLCRYFEKPKLELEQYPTPPEIAARMLYAIETSYEDIEGKSVLDLGCGGAILACGSAILGAEYVLGIDIDPDALELAKSNIEELEVDVDLLQANVITTDLSMHAKMFDTVIMNPPFGTRAKGADMAFLKRGVDVASGAVYSLHKSSTREHIMKKAAEWNTKGEVVAELRFNIPALYKFHQKKSVDVEVDLIKLTIL
eukprot:TRINITY_DN7627_c0_g1_i1.p1 TRINITY_DN7627_c0_g1~~TRINITY_DN7627_c0_g1_i1.p1  ORF type:complete len:207 (-),score=58.25 TRINITY_DN7627_c0_g1_i1:30-650(-)